MAASQLFFAGRLTSIPGAQTLVDASALEVAALGAVGIVAVMDVGIGGKPYTEVDTADEWPRATHSGQVLATVREGDLREMGAIMFSPSNDPDIPSGAQEVLLVKVNPAAASEQTFANGDGDALTLTSQDFGLFTTQVKVTIAAGTNEGKSYLVEFEDESELFDDVGGDGKFSLLYTGGAGKAEVSTVTVDSGGVQLDFSRSDAGLDTGFTQPAPGSALEAVSSNAGDTTQSITVFGLTAANIPQLVTTALNGTSVVAIGAATWNLVTASTLSAVTAGNVTLRIASAGATVVVFTAGQTSKGYQALSIPLDGNFTVVADGATTRQLVVRGTNAAGTVVAHRVVLTGGAPVAVVSTIRNLTSWELGNVEAAREVTLAGANLAANLAAYPNLQKLKDRIATMPDFTFVSLVGNPAEMLVADLDYVTGTTVFGVTAVFYASLYDAITAINAGSELVTATRATGATGAPSNTAGAIYLAGGHEGDPGDPGTPTATINDWTAAFEKLKQVYKNTIVVGSTSASVHALADAHAAFMGGAGEQECDVVCAAAAGETFSALKTRALNLNSRHVRLCGQEVKLFNTAGESVWQPPKFLAALVAAMQAGAKEPGTPLTKKAIKVQDVRQHSSWNPIDDGNAAIQGGLFVLRRKEGDAVRVLRNITTHLSSSISAYTEAAQNQEANIVAWSLRTLANIQIGKKAFSKTPNAIKGILIGELDRLMREEGGQIIFGYQPPLVSLVDDTAAVSVGVALVPGINFIPITIHLQRATA